MTAGSKMMHLLQNTTATETPHITTMSQKFTYVEMQISKIKSV